MYLFYNHQLCSTRRCQSQTTQDDRTSRKQNTEEFLATTSQVLPFSTMVQYGSGRHGLISQQTSPGTCNNPHARFIISYFLYIQTTYVFDYPSEKYHSEIIALAQTHDW